MLCSAPGMIVGLTLAAIAFHCAYLLLLCALCYSDAPLSSSHDRTYRQCPRHGCTVLSNLVRDRVAVDDHLCRVVREWVGERALATG